MRLSEYVRVWVCVRCAVREIKTVFVADVEQKYFDVHRPSIIIGFKKSKLLHSVKICICPICYKIFLVTGKPVISDDNRSVTQGLNPIILFLKSTKLDQISLKVANFDAFLNV